MFQFIIRLSIVDCGRDEKHANKAYCCVCPLMLMAQFPGALPKFPCPFPVNNRSAVAAVTEVVSDVSILIVIICCHYDEN